MKYWILLATFCASCLMAAGELSEDQLEDAEDLVKIGAVRDKLEKKESGKRIMMEVDFSSKDKGMGDVHVRLAVELTDKEKNTYLVEETGRFRDNMGGDYTGNGYWHLNIPYGSFDKLKITAYAFEFGLMDGKKFVPFDADYDDVDTYEELTARTKTPFPGKCNFGMVRWVDH